MIIDGVLIGCSEIHISTKQNTELGLSHFTVIKLSHHFGIRGNKVRVNLILSKSSNQGVDGSILAVHIWWWIGGTEGECVTAEVET